MLGQDLCVSPSTVPDEFGIVFLKDTEAMLDAVTSGVITTSGIPTITIAIIAVTNIVVAVVTISDVIVAVVIIANVVETVIAIAKVANSVFAIWLLSEFQYGSRGTKCNEDRSYGKLINRRHGGKRFSSLGGSAKALL